MPTNLTWDDLLIQNISAEDGQKWLSLWPDRDLGQVAPVFMSKFGDWFLRRPDGSTHELSGIEGTLQQLASTPEEFVEMVNDPEWQTVHLLATHVAMLHERGIIPGPGQCYGFAPHPTVSGRIELEHVMLFDIAVWQSICAQSCQK